MRKQASTGLYIDEHRRIIQGEAALPLIVNRNEERFFEAGKGIVCVDEKRWEEAQRYERLTWTRDGRFAADDRNEYHLKNFANYVAIRDRHFSNGIELGCGPFTNFRLILQTCQVDNVSLLDPLIPSYLSHPFCAYPKSKIGGVLRPSLLLRDLRYPSTFLRNRRNVFQVGGWFGRTVSLFPVTIEDFLTTAKFDLVIMINVLEHCRDANAVLGQILRLLLPGGTFIFADVAWDSDDVQRTVPISYDAGHPLRISSSFINEFLESNFTTQMSRERDRETNAGGVQIHKRELYYIGTRTIPLS